MTLPRYLLWIPALVVVLVVAAVLSREGFIIIESGNVGVKTRLGRILPQELGAGPHFFVPLIEKVEPVFTKTVMVNYSGSEVQKPSTEEIIYEPTLMGEDSTGLPIGLDLTIEVDPVDNQMAEMFIEVGRTGFDKKVMQTNRSAGREILATYQADSVMAKRAALTQDLQAELQRRFDQIPFYRLISVQLKAILLPEQVRNAIEKVAITRQAAAANREQAEAMKALAQGKAEAARIEAQGSADALTIEAKAKATAFRLINEAIANNPNVVRIRHIEAWEKTGGKVPHILVGGEAASSFLYDVSRVGGAVPPEAQGR